MNITVLTKLKLNFIKKLLKSLQPKKDGILRVVSFKMKMTFKHIKNTFFTDFI